MTFVTSKMYLMPTLVGVLLKSLIYAGYHSYMVFIFKEEEYVIANSLSQPMAHRCPKLAHQSPTMGSFEPLRPTWKFDYITQVILTQQSNFMVNAYLICVFKHMQGLKFFALIPCFQEPNICKKWLIGPRSPLFACINDRQLFWNIQY